MGSGIASDISSRRVYSPRSGTGGLSTPNKRSDTKSGKGFFLNDAPEITNLAEIRTPSVASTAKCRVSSSFSTKPSNGSSMASGANPSKTSSKVFGMGSG